jgi:hypothetical protein
MSLLKKIRNLFKKKHPDANKQSYENTPENKQVKDEYKSLFTENKVSSAVPGTKVNTVVLLCTPNHNYQHTGEPEKKENADKCKVTSMTVQKEGRDFQLLIPENSFKYFNKEYKNISVYDVVSGPIEKPITISISAIGLVGPCNELHKNHAFNLNQQDIKVLSKEDRKLMFKVFSRSFSKSVSIVAFVQLIKYIFNHSSSQYRINYSLCGFNCDTTINVFPKLSASAEFFLDFTWKFTKKGNSLENVENPEGGVWNKFNFEFKVEHDSIVLISIKKENKVKEEKTDLEKFCDSFEDGLNILNQGLTVFLSESQTLEVKFNPKIKGSCSLTEVQDLPFVDTEYKVELGFSPLIGFDAKADVSGALLNAIPAIGPFLNAAVNAAESTELVDIFLGFIIKGELTLNTVFTKDAGRKLNSNDLTISFSGKITIDLKGRVASEHSFWRIHYSMGAEIGAESGVKVEETKLIEDDSGLYCPLDISFLGLILYYQAYINGGISERTNKIPKVVEETSYAVAGNQEIEDPQELPDKNKTQLIKPSTIYKDDFYIIGGKN